MADVKYRVKTLPPDGGWGYMCLLGMLLCMMLFGLSVRAFGIIYVILLERFSTTATVAASVGAVNILAWGFFAPISSKICTRWGCRESALIGSLVQCVGFILTAFAPNVAFVFCSFGLLVGVGMSMATTASYLIVSQYFDKRRALATSFGSCGGAVAMLIIPPGIRYLTETYSFTGTMLILGAISLHGLIAAALFRPVPTLRIPILEEETREAKKNEVQCKDRMPSSPNMIDSNCDKVGYVSETLLKSIDNLGTTSDREKQTDCDINETVTSSDGIQLEIYDSKVGKTTKSSLDSLEKISSLEKNSPAKRGTMELLRDPLVASIMLVNMGSAMVSSSMSVFTPSLVIENDYSKTLAFLLVSYNGIADAVGKMGIGYIMDTTFGRPYFLHIYGLCSLLNGLSCLLLPLFPHYAYTTLLFIINALFLGVIFAQRTTVFVHVVGAKQMPLLFGVVQGANAIGLTFGRGIGGVLRDVTGSYDLIFYLSGIAGIICSIVFLLAIFKFDKK